MRKWPLVAVALHTGLRRAEQFHLRWENIDFECSVLTVLARSRARFGTSR